MLPQFLQTAFLSGLAALAVPILIHFFFRLRSKKVELGTIRFLRHVIQENARRRKLMRWLLLTLRMAFVALLVVLFARPYLTAQTHGGDRDLLVILIDQSATMQLKSEHGRLVDQAVEEVKKVLGSVSPGTRVEIAFFDHAIHPLTASTTTELTTVKSLVERLQPPKALFGSTNYGVAFAWARDICVKAPPGHKQLHLFTDLQRTGLDWTESGSLPSDVQPHLHDLGNSVVNNVAITEVRVPRSWVRPGEAPTIQVSVLHAGVFTLNEIPIVLELGRVDVDSKLGEPSTIPFSKLADRITRREKVKLDPGSTVVLNFEFPPLNEGLWQGRITVEYDDEMAFDNQRFFAVSATPAYRVLVLNDDTSRSASGSETYFLETALRLAPEGETYSESPFDPVVQAYDPGKPLPALSDFDAVVLANVGGMTRDDAGRLASFVKAGGGLLIFTGDNISAASCSSLNEVGLGVGIIGEPRVTVDLPWRVSRWDETHPAFQPLSDPQHGDLRRLIFAAYTRVTPSPEASVVMQFGTGDPAILESRVGEGSVMWLTVSCGRDWSDWSRSRLFLPLVHQLLGYEVGLVQGGRIKTRLVDLEPKPDRLNGEVRGMRKNRSDDSNSMANQPNELVLLPGVWRFPRYAEVVNINPLESDVERCDREEFENRFGMKFVDSDDSTSPKVEMGNVELMQDEVWHWAACALLVVILIEGFVGNRTTA